MKAGPDGDRRHFRAEQIGSRGRGPTAKQKFEPCCIIAPDRDGWKPPIVRTMATEGVGIDALAEAIEQFRAQREASGSGREPVARSLGAAPVALAGRAVLLERALTARGGSARWNRWLRKWPNARRDPYAAVRELAGGRNAKSSRARTLTESDAADDAASRGDRLCA